MKRLNVVEFALAITALISMITAGVIGNQISKIETTGRVTGYRGGFMGVQNVANALDTGYEGGAIGFGIISAACILGIVWIETVRIKQER